MEPTNRTSQKGNNKGQALIETLILLPVIFLLLLGAADFNMLAVISAKVEIASRYNALQNAFGDRFHYDRPFPDSHSALLLAEEAEWLFFDDTLDDGPDAVETDDPDVTHHHFTHEELPYDVPETVSLAWQMVFQALSSYDINYIHGNQVFFDYDLLGFPFHRYPWLPDDTVSPGFTSELAPDYALHGDFVVLADPFSGNTGLIASLAWLAEAGIAEVPTAAFLYSLFSLILFGLIPF